MEINRIIKQVFRICLISILIATANLTTYKVSADEKTSQEIIENSTSPKENLEFIKGDLDSDYVEYTYAQDGKTFLVKEQENENLSVQSIVYVKIDKTYEKVLEQKTEVISNSNIRTKTKVNDKTTVDIINFDNASDILSPNKELKSDKKIELGPWKSATYYGSKGITSKTLKAIKAVLVTLIQAKVKPLKAGIISGLDSVVSDIFKNNTKKVWYKEFYQYRTEKRNQFHITNDDVQVWWYSNSSRTKFIPPKTQCKRSFL